MRYDRYLYFYNLCHRLNISALSWEKCLSILGPMGRNLDLFLPFTDVNKVDLIVRPQVRSTVLKGTP